MPARAERAPKIVRSRDEIVRDDARSDATRGRGRLRAGRGGGAPAKADACEARADIGLPGRVKPPARGSVGGPGGGMRGQLAWRPA